MHMLTAICLIIILIYAHIKIIMKKLVQMQIVKQTMVVFYNGKKKYNNTN